MGHLGTVCVGIIPKHVLTGQDLNTTAFNKTAPIGTGPFKFKELKAADHVTLVAYDDYHFGRPLLDTFNWKIVPDANTQLAQVRTGELDGRAALPAAGAVAAGLRRRDGRERAAGRLHLHRAEQEPPPVQGRARYARPCSHALDREAIIKKIYLDQYKIASGPIPPAISWAHDDAVTKYGFDLKKAKALMAEAGWTAGPDGVLARGRAAVLVKMTRLAQPRQRADAGAPTSRPGRRSGWRRRSSCSSSACSSPSVATATTTT